MTKQKLPPVWWVNAENYRVKNTQIQPYFEGVDRASGNDMLSEMSKLSRTLHEKAGPLDLETSRLQLRWHYPQVSAKKRDIADFSKIAMGTLLISEAMKDLLEGFDLGQTQILELPLFDMVKAYGRGRADPDLSKKDPRRWYLLHILEERDTLIPELSVGLHGSNIDWADGKTRWTLNHDVPPELTIHPGVIGTGHLWWDPMAPQFLFFSDELKREIKAQKMRARLLSFKKCKFRAD